MKNYIYFLNKYNRKGIIWTSNSCLSSLGYRAYESQVDVRLVYGKAGILLLSDTRGDGLGHWIRRGESTE